MLPWHLKLTVQSRFLPHPQLPSCSSWVLLIPDLWQLRSVRCKTKFSVLGSALLFNSPSSSSSQWLDLWHHPGPDHCSHSLLLHPGLCSILSGRCHRLLLPLDPQVSLSPCRQKSLFWKVSLIHVSALLRISLCLPPLSKEIKILTVAPRSSVISQPPDESQPTLFSLWFFPTEEQFRYSKMHRSYCSTRVFHMYTSAGNYHPDKGMKYFHQPRKFLHISHSLIPYPPPVLIITGLFITLDSLCLSLNLIYVD